MSITYLLTSTLTSRRTEGICKELEIRMLAFDVFRIVMV